MSREESISSLQRTRRPRFRSGRSLRSLGSPLNARLLGDLSFAFAVAGLLMARLLGASTGKPELLLSTEEQLAKADLVAFVSIRAADSDLSRHTVYRGRITESVKGGQRDQTVCFQTPFAASGLEVGAEYLVFLEARDLSDLVSQHPSALDSLCPAGLPRFRTLDKGSRPMMVRFRNDVPTLCPEERCPLGTVAVEVSGLGFPEFVETFPKRLSQEAYPARWVRKGQLVLALRWQLGAGK
jgi:hypothetical protein